LSYDGGGFCSGLWRPSSGLEEGKIAATFDPGVEWELIGKLVSSERMEFERDKASVFDANPENEKRTGVAENCPADVVVELPHKLVRERLYLRASDSMEANTGVRKD
jgi:hypothetical protein